MNLNRFAPRLVLAVLLLSSAVFADSADADARVGQTLSIGSEVTAARGKLKGETMRFVIEANGLQFPTGPYMIIEVARDFPSSR